MYFMYNKLKFIHRKIQSVFFFKFIMIRLLSGHHPAANPSLLLPLRPAAGQRGRGGEGLAEAQLPHIFQDGVSPFAPAWNHSGTRLVLPARGRDVGFGLIENDTNINAISMPRCLIDHLSLLL